MVHLESLRDAEIKTSRESPRCRYLAVSVAHNCYAPAPIAGALSDDARLTSDVAVAYIGPRSRTERPRKTKICTEVTHVTRDSIGHHFQGVKRSKVNLQVAGAYCCGLPHSLLFLALRPTLRRAILSGKPP